MMENLSEAAVTREGVREHARDQTRMRHELRAPMNHIIGYCEMMLEETVDGDEAVWVSTSLQQLLGAAKTLLYNINDCLDIARVDPGRSKERSGLLIVSAKDIINGIDALIRLDKESGEAEFGPDIEKLGGSARHLLCLLESVFKDGEPPAFCELPQGEEPPAARARKTCPAYRQSSRG
ncbi:MAG: hypothetical protein HY894_03905 [Deltaproteobacteria bacterium]|nr:hypothetical protein [Deltaproteobacteria bacterium]